MRIPRFIGWRYTWDRLLLMHYERKHPDHPWLTRDAVEFLAQWLRPQDVGLELGAGRSTLWFAQRIGSLISVEHNAEWHRRVAERLARAGLCNVELHFRSAVNEQPDEARRALLPVIEAIASNSLDLVLVDGIIRDHCALSALPKIRPGGVLVVDNANWFLPCKSRAPNSRGAQDGAFSPEWEELLGRIRNWRCYWTTNGVTDTAMFFKPSLD